MATLIVLVACTQNPTGSTAHQLAADQTIRIPIDAVPQSGGASLDPGLLSSFAETAIGQNLFDGLYSYDDHMHEQPDLAEGPPEVSSDGTTYTFHIRPNARFWNGDPVTASDFVYSWNRAAALQGDWASSAFQPVAGYDAVAQAGQITTTTHLDISAPDAHTLVAHLSQPAGYWIAALVLPVAWVVDPKVVESAPDRWWTTPDSLVGTGPFRMTDWKADGQLDFAPVLNWWGGSTGTLESVELHVVSRPDAWSGYASGQYDIVGYGFPGLTAGDMQSLASIRSIAAHRTEIHSWTLGATTMLAFNLQTGPLSGFADGRELRMALSQAIDRRKLAEAVCQDGALCVPATGGAIAKGLAGYLGDSADPGAKFDPAGARATVKRLDPNGTLLRGLTLYYPVQAINPSAALAANLAAQWSANLGVTVASKALDNDTFYADESNGRMTLWRLGWLADYDNPQDWFDNLFMNHPGCGQPLCNSAGTVYDGPGFKQLITGANQKPLASALPDYMKAERMLVDDYAVAALLYNVQTLLIKPYIQGFSVNALWETRWTSLRVLQH